VTNNGPAEDPRTTGTAGGAVRNRDLATPVTGMPDSASREARSPARPGHRAGQADRAGDRRGVQHAGLESADPRGAGRLPAVAGRLRVADVLLVNPIRDGMTLVAQEGPVLSREAGAAATLGDHALLINPYDISETAAALHQALAMPDAGRQRRAGCHRRRGPARPLAGGPDRGAADVAPRGHLGRVTARRRPGG
jgi:Glycosyltransferase family 20